MKVDGITLLQMIKDGKIKDNTKIIDNTGKRYIYYDSTGNLNEITQLIGDDEETERMFQFKPYQLINYTFEIKEIEKTKKIELIDNSLIDIDELGKHTITTNKKDRNIYIPRINWLIDKVDYLLKKEEK